MAHCTLVWPLLCLLLLLSPAGARAASDAVGPGIRDKMKWHNLCHCRLNFADCELSKIRGEKFVVGMENGMDHPFKWFLIVCLLLTYKNGLPSSTTCCTGIIEWDQD